MLAGGAGVKFPDKIFAYLVNNKGMSIEEVIRPYEACQEEYSPLNYAIQWSAANIAIWLLENRADVSKVTCIDESLLWQESYTNVDDKVALLDELGNHGFDFNASITSKGIENLVECAAMSVDDKLKLLAVLKKHSVDFKKIHDSTYGISDSIIDFLLPAKNLSDDQIYDRVRLLAALVEPRSDVNRIDQMGHQILGRIISLKQRGYNCITFFKKILEDPKDVDIRDMLYNTLFSMGDDGDGHQYLPWEVPIHCGYIGLALLLIKKIKPEDAKVKPLLDIKHEIVYKDDEPMTQYDRAQDWLHERQKSRCPMFENEWNKIKEALECWN